VPAEPLGPAWLRPAWDAISDRRRGLYKLEIDSKNCKVCIEELGDNTEDI
jgi:hypothetical protein